MAQPSSIFAYMKEAARHIVRMRDVQFEPSLFRNYLTGTALDELLCSYKGLPKGVNYMVIGDPGVGKTTIIMDMLSDIRMISSSARVLFISAEMNEIDLAVYASPALRKHTPSCKLRRRNKITGNPRTLSRKSYLPHYLREGILI